MRVDIVQAAAPYFGIYLDGQLEYWGEDDPFPTLIEAINDRVVKDWAYHTLGAFGCEATLYEDPSDWIGDIPVRWWSDDRYVDGFNEEYDA